MKAITDCHVHFRQGEMSKVVIPETTRYCEHVIAMPNTDPPITSYDDVMRYRDYYTSCHSDKCTIHMTGKLNRFVNLSSVEGMIRAGVVGLKLYPEGMTTNSDDGIPHDWLTKPPKLFLEILHCLEENDTVLLNHGEMPNTFVLDRESEYLHFMSGVVHEFPRLRVTLEHISTKEGIDWVIQHKQMGCRVLGTLTLHHATETLDAVIGRRLDKWMFCKPVFKRPEDRTAIIEAMSLPGFAFGSDSAPHSNEAKDCGCAGIYSAPVIPEAYQAFFGIDVTNFLSVNGNAFYGFPANTTSLTIDRSQSYTIGGGEPHSYLEGKTFTFKMIRVGKANGG